MGSQDVVVLGDPFLTQDLLASKGKYTSNRPDSFSAHDFGQSSPKYLRILHYSLFINHLIVFFSLILM